MPQCRKEPPISTSRSENLSSITACLSVAERPTTRQVEENIVDGIVGIRDERQGVDVAFRDFRPTIDVRFCSFPSFPSNSIQYPNMSLHRLQDSKSSPRTYHFVEDVSSWGWLSTCVVVMGCRERELVVVHTRMFSKRLGKSSAKKIKGVRRNFFSLGGPLAKPNPPLLPSFALPESAQRPLCLAKIWDILAQKNSRADEPYGSFERRADTGGRKSIRSAHCHVYHVKRYTATLAPQKTTNATSQTCSSVLAASP